MSSTQQPQTEYALMVQWSDGTIEYVTAVDVAHAERMATTIYAHRPSWTVGRDVQPWRYVRVTEAELTTEVAL